MNFSYSLAERTDYPICYTSYTSSESSSASGQTAYNSFTSAVTVSNGISSTVMSSQGWATQVSDDTTFHISYSASQSQQGATTLYEDATQTSASTSDAFTSYHYGTTRGFTFVDSTFQTTNNTGSYIETGLLSDTFTSYYFTDVTFNRTTTSNLPYTSTHWIISGTGASGFLTSNTQAVTVVSTTTDVGTSSVWTNSTTNTTFSTYYDQISVYSADTDWLWLINHSADPVNYLSSIASSADNFTIFPSYTTVNLNYASVADPADFTGTFSIADATTVFSFQDLTNTTTTSSTVISGDSIPFATQSTSFDVWTTTTDSSIVGNYGTVVTAATTSSYTLPTVLATTEVQTVTYPVGFNTSTTELTQLVSYITTTTSYTTPNAYLVSQSSEYTDASGDEGESESGWTYEGTDISFVGYSTFIFQDTYQQAINPIAASNAFLVPNQLHSSGQPFTFADNISVEGTTLPFPAFSGVLTNASIPALGFAFTTTGTNSHSYSYQWTSDLLLWTQYQTSLSSGLTVTFRTISSGTFHGGEEISSTYYQDGGTIYGGYPAIPSAAESVQFPPRAVLATSISATGASSTYYSLVTSSQYSEISGGTVIIENSVPAFAVFPATTDGGLDGALMVYPRNADG